MRILGLDFGDKSIGLAVSDKLQLTAQGLGRYQTKNKKVDRKFFKDLVAKYEIQEIIIGLPLRMNGSQGSRVDKTKDFARWLENILNLPIIFWDERLTTKQAYKILRQQKMKHKKRKSLKDQVSATIILASYLEFKRSKIDAP